MLFPIVTADERRKQKRGIKGCIFGEHGIGKTSLLKTLDVDTTLFFNIEAGEIAVEDWDGDSFEPRTWEECRDFAVFLGGANPAYRDDQLYSQAHFDDVCKKYGDPSQLDKFETIFIDSISVAGRFCFQWCKGQPQAYSEKSGKPDTRGAYGLHGNEMISWLTQLQHTKNKNVWFVGGLDQKVDDYKKKYFEPQIEGSKTGLELPGIVDQVVTMAKFKAGDGTLYRAFVNHTLNEFGYPAKDRSGRLELIEEPHLGKLMKKIKGRHPNNAEAMQYGIETTTTENAN